MSWIQYVLPLFFSCFTGWFVMWVSLKLIFRPHKAIKLAGFTLQGVLPANQNLIAANIGRLVSSQLFSFSALEEKVTDPENFNKLKPEIETHIDSFLRERLKDTFPMLAMLIGDKTINQLKTAFILELETLFPILMKSYLGKLENDLDIEKTVVDKIAGFSMSQVEDLVYKSAQKQLIKAQLFGAGVGLIIGFIHLIFIIQLYRL